MSSTAEPDELAKASIEARTHPEWVEFAVYAELRSKGLRAQAFTALSGFIERSAAWDFTRRLEFVLWVLESRLFVTSTNPLTPQPIWERLIVPTVREWADRQPTDANAHLWLGLVGCDDPTKHLERALELDPRLERARRTLVEWAFDDIDYNQHHMPDFYIHDPRIDLVELDRIATLIDGSDDCAWAGGAKDEARALRSNAERWLVDHPDPGDFATS